MNTEDGKKIITEMNEFITLAEKVSAADAETSAANASLLTECLDDFGTELLSFEETTALLFNQVENLFSISQNYARCTDDYLTSCKHLSKGIRYLAGACVTKAALKQKGKELPLLESLTVDKLGRMASFTIRKCNDAINETMREKKAFPLDVFSMQLQYTGLMDRLRATESTISKIKWCLADPWKYAKGALALQEKKDPNAAPETPASAFRRAPSIPMVRIESDPAKVPGSTENSRPQTETVSAGTALPKLLPAPASPVKETLITAASPLPAPASAEAAAAAPDDDVREVTFTAEEMIELLENPAFCRDHPDLAEVFRNALREFAESIEWTEDDS